MGKKVGALRSAAEYHAARALVAGLSVLPPAAAGWTGRRLGGLFRMLDGRHRRRVREQAADRLGLSGRALACFVRDNFHAYGMALAEFALLSRMNPEDFESRIDNLEPFARFVRSLREEGKGVLLVTAHFGNWEWCNSVARPLGFEGGSIARPLDNPRLNEFVRSVRERNGLRIFDKAGAIRKALGALRDNNLVGVLIDQDAGRGGVMSPFLGKPASTLTIPVELAVRAGCPLVVAALRRNTKREPGQKRFAMLYNPEPYRPAAGADEYAKGGAEEKAEAKRLVDALNAGLGEIILSAPEQWFWLHRRWKSAGQE